MFDLIPVMPLVAGQTEHSKINSISPHAHVFFSILSRLFYPIVKIAL